MSADVAPTKLSVLCQAASGNGKSGEKLGLVLPALETRGTSIQEMHALWYVHVKSRIIRFVPPTGSAPHPLHTAYLLNKVLVEKPIVHQKEIAKVATKGDKLPSHRS